jgi:hypothetical protein
VPSIFTSNISTSAREVAQAAGSGVDPFLAAAAGDSVLAPTISITL